MAMSTRSSQGFTKPRRHHVLVVVIVAATLGVICLLPFFQDAATHDRPVVTPSANTSPGPLTTPTSADTGHSVSSRPGVFAGASRLLLTGVFFSVTEAHKSYAVIRNEKAEERQFRLGERVSGDIYIQHIYPDHVVIASGNRTEILWLGGSHVIARAASGAEPEEALMGADAGHKGEAAMSKAGEKVRSPLTSLLSDPMALLGEVGATRSQPSTSARTPRLNSGRTTGSPPSSVGEPDHGIPPAWTYDPQAFEAWWNTEEAEDPPSDEDRKLDAWLNSDEDFPPE